MKRIIFIIAMLWGVASYGQTIGYMRYDTVKIFTTKPGGRGSLDVTGNVRFTGLLPMVAGTDSVVVRDVNGNLGTTAKSAFGGTYTASNGLTMASNNVKLGGALIENTTINGTGFDFGVQGYRVFLGDRLGVQNTTYFDLDDGVSSFEINTNLPSGTQLYVAALGADSTMKFQGHGKTYIGDYANYGNETYIEVNDPDKTIETYSDTLRIYNNTSTTSYSDLIMNSTGLLRINQTGSGTKGTLFSEPITVGVASGTTGRLNLSGTTSGTVGITTAAAAGTWSLTLPVNDGDADQVLKTDGSGVTSWATPAAGGLTVGTTPIASGTDTRVLFDDAGVLGEDAGMVFNKTSNNLTVGSVTASNLTSGRIPIAGASGLLGDNANLTYDGSTLNINQVSAPLLGGTVMIKTTAGLSNLQMHGILNGTFLSWHDASTAAYRVAQNLDASANFIQYRVTGAAGSESFAEVLKIANATGIVTMATYGAGTATFDASGNISSVSDTRLKNVQGYSKIGLKQVLKLNPIDYKWNEKSGNERLHTYTGFSAQNVKENIPNGTGQMADGYLTLQDRAIMAAMVNAIKELNDKIEKLEKEVKRLQK